MRKLLASFTLLASALFVAGCGGSNANSVPHTGEPSVASLNGQYVFQEQVYTFYANGAATPKQAAYAGAFHRKQALTRVPEFPHRAKALAFIQAHPGSHLARPLPAAMKNALPESGDANSFVVWGASVGSLTFDGNGHITAGEIDFNEPTAGIYTTDSVTGSYTMDPQQVGTISLSSTTSGDTYDFQIALQGGTGVSTGSQATGAQLLEGNADASGDVEIGTGQMLQQSGTQSQSTLNGSYIFGVQGVTCLGCSQLAQGDLIAAGVLTADGAGNFTTGEADIATTFATDNLVSVAGTYTAPDNNGRSTAALTATGYTNGALPADYVIYTANSSTAFIMSTDQSTDFPNVAAPYLSGEMNAQTGSLSNASLSGNYVVGETTEDLRNEATPDTYSDAFIALLSASGGTLSGTADTNIAGLINSGVAINYGAYSVGSKGRVTLNGHSLSGAAAPVFYISGNGIGYGVDQLYGNSTQQEPGLLYMFAQTGSGFSNSSLNGNYAFGDLPAATSNVGLDSSQSTLTGPGLVNGDLSADGNGNLTGEGADAYINGDGGIGDFNGTYAIGSNGRGTIMGATNDSAPLLGNEVFYLAGTGMALAMDVTPNNTAPSIQIIQQ